MNRLVKPSLRARNGLSLCQQLSSPSTSQLLSSQLAPAVGGVIGKNLSVSTRMSFAAAAAQSKLKKPDSSSPAVSAQSEAKAMRQKKLRVGNMEDIVKSIKSKTEASPYLSKLHEYGVNMTSLFAQQRIESEADRLWEHTERKFQLLEEFQIDRELIAEEYSKSKWILNTPLQSLKERIELLYETFDSASEDNSPKLLACLGHIPSSKAFKENSTLLRSILQRGAKRKAYDHFILNYPQAIAVDAEVINDNLEYLLACDFNYGHIYEICRNADESVFPLGKVNYGLSVKYMIKEVGFKNYQILRDPPVWCDTLADLASTKAYHKELKLWFLRLSKWNLLFEPDNPHYISPRVYMSGNENVAQVIGDPLSREEFKEVEKLVLQRDSIAERLRLRGEMLYNEQLEKHFDEQQQSSSASVSEKDDNDPSTTFIQQKHPHPGAPRDVAYEEMMAVQYFEEKRKQAALEAKKKKKTQRRGSSSARPAN